MRVLIVTGLVVLATLVEVGATPVTTNVQFLQNKSVHLKMEFMVDAPVERIHAVLTDYANLAQIHPSIIVSQQLQSPDPQVSRVETVTQDCILFFCKTIRRVEDISSPSKQRINSMIVAQFSDFSSGVAAWTLTPAQGSTRILYESTVKPKFYTPSFGVGIIQHRLRARLKEAATKIHQIAITSPLG